MGKSKKDSNPIDLLFKSSKSIENISKVKLGPYRARKSIEEIEAMRAKLTCPCGSTKFEMSHTIVDELYAIKIKCECGKTCTLRHSEFDGNWLDGDWDGISFETIKTTE